MKITYMSEDVDVGSTFVKNVGFAARSRACSRSISALTLMSGLMCVSCVTSPSKRKVWVGFFSFLEANHLFMATLDFESHFITNFHRQ